MTKIEEKIAEELVAPTLLKLLKPYSSAELTHAINDNINLAKGLQANPEYLSSLQMLTRGVPFVDQLAKKVRQKKWIIWFINNAMQHKRPDLYAVVGYHPNGKKYLLKEIRRLTKLIFA